MLSTGESAGTYYCRIRDDSGTTYTQAVRVDANSDVMFAADANDQKTSGYIQYSYTAPHHFFTVQPGSDTNSPDYGRFENYANKRLKVDIGGQLTDFGLISVVTASKIVVKADNAANQKDFNTVANGQHFNTLAKRQARPLVVESASYASRSIDSGKMLDYRGNGNSLRLHYTNGMDLLQPYEATRYYNVSVTSLPESKLRSSIAADDAFGRGLFAKALDDEVHLDADSKMRIFRSTRQNVIGYTKEDSGYGTKTCGPSKHTKRRAYWCQ
mgnify:CR=1 FL=1